MVDYAAVVPTVAEYIVVVVVVLSAAEYVVVVLSAAEYVVVLPDVEYIAAAAADHVVDDVGEKFVVVAAENDAVVVEAEYVVPKVVPLPVMMWSDHFES